MIYFLYGKDTYRSREKLKEIIEGYKKIHKSGLNFKVFDFSDKSVAFGAKELKSNFSQVSMFKEKKMIVFLGLFLNPELKNDFAKNFKDIFRQDDLLVVFEEGEADSKSALFKFLKEEAKCQKFDLLSGTKLKNWVIEELKKYKSKAEPFVVEKLISRIGSDLWQMSNEIKKLSCFRKNSCILLKDIDIFIKPKIESDIFKTIDAVALKNKKEALALIHKHIENGDSPSYLFSMVNYQFRNVLNVKDLADRRCPFDLIIKKSGLHPYVVKKSYLQAQSFTADSLKKIYHKIFQTDLDVKTGRLKAEEALDIIVSEI